jgi:iron uptake system component EfeO
MHRVLGVALLPVLVLALSACGDATDAVVQTSSIAVVADEYAFQPEAITVPAGEVTFKIDNQGSLEHEFEILQGDRVVDEAEDLIPGLERDLVVKLQPGEYQFVCRIDDHEQRGMTGTLTVTP